MLFNCVSVSGLIPYFSIFFFFRQHLDKFVMIPNQLVDNYLNVKQPFDTSNNIPKDATLHAQKRCDSINNLKSESLVFPI